MIFRPNRLTPDGAQKMDQAGDAFLIAIAACVGAVDGHLFYLQIAAPTFAVAILLWWFASRVLRQYDAGNGRGFVGDLVLTLLLLAAIVLPIGLLRTLTHFPGPRLLPFSAVLVPGVFLLRTYFVGRRLRRVDPVADVLLVGTGPLGRLTGTVIRRDSTHRRVLGFVKFDDETPNVRRLRAPVLGTIDQLQAILERLVVDEVYFASTARQHAADVQNAIRTCERLGVPFALPVCPYRLGRATPSCAKAVADGYVHYLSVQNKPLQLWMKRALDIFISGSALVVLSPLLLVAAAAVKLTSRGRVLFAQERVGLHGRTFRMLKFRSMVANAEQLKSTLLAQNEQQGPVFKIARDPRVTSVGRFLRKYSIDELPQLVNVLRGDMSIVGPRPPLLSEVARYEAWQRRRLSVRPGLTCVWQVSGRNRISFEDWMLLDMLYIDHWNLARDFDLILRTVPVVLTGRGAS